MPSGWRRWRCFWRASRSRRRARAATFGWRSSSRLLLAGLAALLYFLPLKKKVEGSLLLRVRVEEGKIAFTQYIGGKEIKKTRRVEAVRRVYKTPFCYYIVFGDIAGAIVCERCLLKKGTFEQFERIFGAKVQPKDIPR